MRKKSAFSLLELLMAMFIIGLIGVSLLKGLSAIKSQDLAIQHFLLNTSSIYETQLFINKNLSIADIDSINITKNGIFYNGYNDLFKPSINNSFMDFSLQTTAHKLELKDNNLYFDDNLLLDKVKQFSIKLTKHNASNATLSYTLCIKKECISDDVFVDKVEIY